MIRGESWVMRWKPAKLTRLLEAKADVGPKLTEGYQTPVTPILVVSIISIVPI